MIKWKDFSAAWFTLMFMLMLGGNIAYAEIAGFVEGKDYEALASAGTDRPVIYEFFNYGCPSCYRMESFNDRVKQKLDAAVKFEYVPAQVHPEWAIYVKAYYLAELLGVLEQSHTKMFARVHQERKPIKNDAELKAFLVELGASAEDYDKMSKSFALNSKIKQAEKLAAKMKVSGTPAYVVNGRYVLNASRLGFEGLERALLTMPKAALADMEQ